jgi:osmoprotectant transport system substrate-binding protein
VLLAEIYSQALESGGVRVERALALGPGEFAGPALSLGLIELLPEYAGTALTFRSLGTAEPGSDAAATHRDLERVLEGTDVTALASAPGQNANTFVVTRATAARYGLQRISDLASIAGELTFGGPPECPTRALCLLGLEERYGLQFGDVVTTLDASGPLTHAALRTGGVDVALMFTTDPTLAEFTELTDDRRLQPAENVTPLVRREVVERWGSAVVDLINGVTAHLDTATLRTLNASAEGADVAAVAATWLRSEELT